MDKYLDAAPEAGMSFFKNFNGKGKIVMMNLLRFRDKADYANLESIKPAKSISGSEAYQRYMDKTLPLLKKAGSRIIFYGECNAFLIGPNTEKWDAMLLVEHASTAEFIAFSQNKEYLAHAGHRTAALDDSRLLPILESNHYG